MLLHDDRLSLSFELYVDIELNLDSPKFFNVMPLSPPFAKGDLGGFQELFGGCPPNPAYSLKASSRVFRNCGNMIMQTTKNVITRSVNEIGR